MHKDLSDLWKKYFEMEHYADQNKTLADKCHNWVMERVRHPNSPTYHVTYNVTSHKCAQRAWTGKEKEVDLSVFVEEMGKCPAYLTRIDFPSGQKEFRFNPGSRR